MTLGKIPVVCSATPVLGPLKVLPTLPGTDGSWETAALVPFVRLLRPWQYSAGCGLLRM